MKILKRGIAVASLIMAMMLFTGCSIGETWDVLWGHNETEDTTTPSTTFDPDAVKVDESVSAPQFAKDLEGSKTYAIGDPAEELKVETVAEDEGVITYQWYVNTVDSNGGGEQVVGATTDAYTPDTQKEGRFYYFVVATHTVDNKINLSTSGIAEIIIDPEQEPAKDKEAEEPKKGWIESKKGWVYYGKNGKKVKNKTVEIEGKKYRFNKKGLMQTGWYEGKKNWFYFGKDGAMVTKSFIEDGGKIYYLDDKGRMKKDAWIEGEGTNRWFYAQGDGSLAVGWTELKGDWYYFNPDGVMRYDTEIEGKWLNPDGRLAH